MDAILRIKEITCRLHFFTVHHSVVAAADSSQDVWLTFLKIGLAVFGYNPYPIHLSCMIIYVDMQTYVQILEYGIYISTRFNMVLIGMGSVRSLITS